MARPVRPAPPRPSGRPRSAPWGRKRRQQTTTLGAGNAAHHGSIPAGLAPLWAFLGAGSPHPMDHADPGDLAAPAGPRGDAGEAQLTPGGRGGQRPLAPLLEPALQPRPTGPVPPGHTPTTSGAGGLYR